MILFRKLQYYFKEEISGLNIAVWGLSFKPGTNDMRDAPSINLIQNLLDHKVNVRVYDPAAMEEAQSHFGDRVHYATDIYDAANNAHAIILVTEWKEFRLPNWGILAKIMKERMILDGRNIYNAEELESNGFTYTCIGRK